MESSQLNLNQVTDSQYKLPETVHTNTAYSEGDNQEVSQKSGDIIIQKIEARFDYILATLNSYFENISAGFNSLLESTTNLTERVAIIEKKTDVSLKMQDHKYFMATLLANSKNDINIALNSLYADNCSELKTILELASYDVKWAHNLRSVLGLNKKYFYADNNPLAASLRKSCNPGDTKYLELSTIDSEKKKNKKDKELDYDKKTIIEDIVKCITEAINAEMYNAESKKVLSTLCDEITKNIKDIFPKTTTFNSSTVDLSKSKAVNKLSDEKEIDNKPNATISAIAEKIDTIANDVNELKESHNELRASLQEEALNK